MSVPKIIVHGGAGGWHGFDEGAVLEGVRAAAQRGWDVLQAGGSALEAVEAATILLEDHPLFDSGFGSFVNQEGEVEMDALIADGTSLRFGAVAGVRRVKNVITLARRVMTETPYCFFVSDGADALAARLGIPLVANISLITDAERQSFLARRREDKPRSELGTGTVGAVALDQNGNLASATSTGGTPDKPKGRVGDSPCFGAGGYADNHSAAASATGQGENIMRVLLCKDAADRSRLQDGGTAVLSALADLEARIPQPEAGIILIDKRGQIVAAHTTNAMPVAWVNGDGTVQVAMRSSGALG